MTDLAEGNLEATGTGCAYGAASRRASPMWIVATVGVAVVGWVVSGSATLFPVVLVGVIAAAGAATDHRSGVIPNGLVVAALGAVAVSWLPVGAVDHRGLMTLLGGVASGCALSGAPALFAVWLVAPRLIGGGDWKLLGVLGMAIGYLAPLAATVIVLVAFTVGLVDAALRRRRHVILGPPLVGGYVVAVIAALVQPDLFGSWIEMGRQ